MTTTLYDVLGVSEDAGREEIADAYRERVKETHPDVSDVPNAEDRLRWVTRAKDVLTNPAERKRYDRLGHTAYCDAEGWADGAAAADAMEYSDAQAKERHRDASASTETGADSQESGTAGDPDGSYRRVSRSDSTDFGTSPSQDAGAAESDWADSNRDPRSTDRHGPNEARERTAYRGSEGTSPSHDESSWEPSDRTDGEDSSPHLGTAMENRTVHPGARTDTHWLQGMARILGTFAAGTMVVVAVFYFLLFPSPVGGILAALGTGLTLVLFLGFGVVVSLLFGAAVLIDDFKI